jgi:hypothetical protein
MPGRGVIAVEKAPGRSVPDRDLRTLSTDELIALIRSDIKELDGIIAAERRAARGNDEKKAARHKTVREAMDAAVPEAEEEQVEMHSVTCCNHHMGDFPPWARVRCPFCNEWHRAGDFPNAS